MIKSRSIILMGISAAAGAAAGILSNRKRPELGGLFGAALGLAAGAISAMAYKRLVEQCDDGIDYYSETSPLYRDFDDVEVE